MFTKLVDFDVNIVNSIEFKAPKKINNIYSIFD